jgi:hypothetical protein
MPAKCKDVLGKKWNLFNGPSSLLYKVDSGTVNAANFYDARTNEVARTPMADWGYNSPMTTRQYLAQPGYVAFVSAYQGRPSNDIILGPVWFTESPADQNLDLLHELLHSYTLLGDNDLAFKIGLGAFVREVDASSALNYFFDSSEEFMGKLRLG